MADAPSAAQYAIQDGRPAKARDPDRHAELAFALRLFLADWSERAIAAGKISKYATVTLTGCADGTAWIHGGGVMIGDHNTPIAETFAEAERFLTRDEKAECNVLLGLTPDGRFADAAE